MSSFVLETILLLNSPVFLYRVEFTESLLMHKHACRDCKIYFKFSPLSTSSSMLCNFVMPCQSDSRLLDNKMLVNAEAWKMFSHLNSPSYAFLCLPGSQNKSWLISKENKLGSKIDHACHPSQRQPRSANSRSTSRILIKSSFDQKKYFTNPQLTSKVQTINAYCSMLIRFCSGFLLSIIMAINYSHRYNDIQVYFFFW